MLKDNKDNLVDFVITWVDANDIEWQREKNKYSKDKKGDNSVIRYRDWEILKYWFRGVEKFAPWVNKIHFITYGHIPTWLNTDNPKLNVVKHTDFIPEKYLPTFNSHTIENNMHLIKELNENFVYFNDDMFIIDEVKKEDFFKNNLPCDSFAENILTAGNKNSTFHYILLNNMEIINNYYNKRQFIKKYPAKFLNIKYGVKNIRTLLLLPWSNFSLIYDTHIPVSLKKQTLYDVWNKEYERFNETCMHKFRTSQDVSQYVFRYWQMLNGKFKPRSFKFGKVFTLKNENKEIYNTIEKQKYKIICINDSDSIDFEKVKKELQNSFERILPEKSSFEK